MDDTSHSVHLNPGGDDYHPGWFVYDDKERNEWCAGTSMARSLTT
jgi:hypothetical protein